MNREKKAIMIAPSILSGNFARIEEEVRKIEDAGADMIHLDVMDGCFVPNITFGPKMVSDIRKITKLPLDAHLMIINPEKYAEKFVDAGADYVTVHAETVADAESLLKHIRSKGSKCGIAFNPDKPVEIIESAAAICDLVLVMSVFPGFSGQKYIDGSDERVRKVKELLIKNNNEEAVIQIDGGINLENATMLANAGADILVTGNTFFLSKNPKEMVRAIKEICTK